MSAMDTAGGGVQGGLSPEASPGAPAQRRVPSAVSIALTAEQLRQVLETPWAPRAPRLGLAQLAAYAPALSAALAEFGIGLSRERVAAFLGQLAHESAGLRHWEEIWGPTPAQTRYEPPGPLAVRLGNTQAGDGFRFRGRGPVQLTGRDNYRRAGAALGLPLEAEPDRVLESSVGFRVAGWFWWGKRRREGEGLVSLSELADRHSVAAYREITRAINGGENGWDDRLRRWRRACDVLGLRAPKEA